MSTESIELEVIDSISDLDAEQWNALVGGFPFFQHTFLKALEDTGCATPETGWMPRFIVARDRTDRLIGAVPMYFKGHSMGEFVYDWAWADAAHRLGIKYYPKAVVAAPFTPATSPRLLVHSELDSSAANELRKALAAAIRRIGESFQMSGSHVLFCEDEDVEALEGEGFFARRHHQYHWHNRGYETFADFLEPFKSKRRREMRRQRRRLAEEGVHVEAFGGDDLTAEHRDYAWTCYLNTIEKFPWGRQYLNEEFYEWIFDDMKEFIRLFIAFDEDEQMIGSALTFLGEDTMYGRYWGATDHTSFLHFETCLYTPIEYAIEHGISKIEPGQGGEHKFARGFEATVTQSMHWISDDHFDLILRRHTAREEEVVISEVEQKNVHSAFQPEDLEIDEDELADKDADS
jgi:predicted N-acyltransferase